jgi:hypothetical protein
VHLPTTDENDENGQNTGPVSKYLLSLRTCSLEAALLQIQQGL